MFGYNLLQVMPESSLGAALAAWYLHYKNETNSEYKKDSMRVRYRYLSNEIEEDLKASNAIFNKVSNIDLLEIVSDELTKQKAVGWMQGRMEFGPCPGCKKYYC